MGSSDRGAAPEANQIEPDDPLTPAVRKLVVGLLIVVGIQAWLILGRSDYGLSFQLELLAAAVVISLLPGVNRTVYSLFQRIRRPSQRAAHVVALLIAIVSACYFPYTGWRQGRNFQPKWQDEMSYVIQFRMLARGRLWMPPYPPQIRDFFDSFQLLIDPVYASMYFPGAALLYAPATWVALPYWVVSAAMSGIAVGLLYLILTELVDGLAGALGALMLVGTTMFRKLSLMIGGHPPLLMLCLGMLYCWLRWRKDRRNLWWATAMGALAGWAAITRPLDALVLASPIGIDLLLSIRSMRWRRWLATVACAVAAGLPFLVLQVVFDIGVTGKWYKTPFDLYAQRDYPGTTLGFHPYDPNLRPVSKLPQKQRFHDEWTVPAIKSHQPRLMLANWPTAVLPRDLADLLPNRMMIALLPAGLLGLFERRRALLALTFPLFYLAFAFYTFALPHYTIIIIPAVILVAVLGARQIELTWPRARVVLGALLPLFIIILSLTEMREFNRLIQDEWFDPGEMRDIDSRLAALPQAPAIVLFRFPPEGNPHAEPVYNIRTAWPDDALIIRAHDLGQRNLDLFRYYAQRQPQRTVYLYDREDGSLRCLGNVADLAEQRG